jgi:hypothetical protein
MTSELAGAMAAGMVFIAATQGGSGREIHVAKSGLDDGVGGREQPYLTLGRAAAVAQPGDVVTVHAGVYREWVRPAQGGSAEHARCVGIILGHAPGVDYGDIDAFGAHIVRNNVIRRCGQAGIAGQKGATRSLISGNFIEDTNYRREFGGWETAAIKFHNTVDTVVSDNLIRGVHHQMQGAFGIWMDFGNQGTPIHARQ